MNGQTSGGSQVRMLPPALAVCSSTQALLPAVAAVHSCLILYNLLSSLPAGLPSSGYCLSVAALPSSEGLFQSPGCSSVCPRDGFPPQLPRVYRVKDICARVPSPPHPSASLSSVLCADFFTLCVFLHSHCCPVPFLLLHEGPVQMRFPSPSALC